jgi:hypothetical protein
MNATEELDAAGRRQAEIDRRVSLAVEDLKARAAARKGKRGRMTVAEQRKEDRLNALLVRLRRGYLPGEIMSAASAPADQVAASARQNLQHHAAGEAAPSGRPAAGGGGGGGSGSGVGGGGGDRARGDGDDDDDDADDDDEDADPKFANYYRVTRQQRAHNVESKDKFKKNAANLKSATFRPDGVLKKGCDRDLIGVGPCHVHAPHLYLGLPKPPCPRCGWPSVDEKCVAANGWTSARRVYDDGVDEWVVGQLFICWTCKKKHDHAQDELKDLEEWEDEEDEWETEIEEARAAVKAATYTYRSYNSISMRIYAERYAWCVAALSTLLT